MNKTLTLAIWWAFIHCATSAEFIVLNSNDDGPGSFREAIHLANSSPGADVIIFNIPGGSPHYIQPITLLPELSDPVTIDGYSQPGASPATHSTPAILKIVLDGRLAEDLHRGLHISSSDIVIKGLVICNFADAGIMIQNCSGNTIEGNYIGLDPTGSEMQGNQGAGIAISNACDNLIGGNRPSARNVISGNGYDGIDISHTGSKRNRIVGNYVGTDATGTRYLPNGVPKGGTGVRINDSAENTVGGLAQGEGNLIMGIAMTNPGVIGNHILGNYINTDITGSKAIMTRFGCGIVILQCSGNVIGPNNVISGCTDAAIYLGSSDPSAPTANTVIGNFIGTDPSGSMPVPNSIGILIEGNSSNIIGGTAADKGNIIAFSQINSSGYGGSGVVIKTDWNGLVPVDNVVVGNKIFGNERLGIDLGDNNVPEMNDEGDFDEGPNRLMNLPVIESVIATPSRLIIRGKIDTQNPASTTIHFYANSYPDEHSGYGEGEIYLGLVTPNRHGFFTAILRPIGAQNDFHYVSATCTDIAGNTSEFSLCAEISESQGKSTAKSAHPLEFGLGQNFPNPFNPITAIEFHLPYVTHVSLTIYDALGKEIIKLADGEMTAGDHIMRWNGTDSRGQQVANGLYFCQLITADYTNTRKMSLCR